MTKNDKPSSPPCQVQQWISVADAAKKYGVGPATVYRWERAGAVKSKRDTAYRPHLLVREADIRRMMRL